MTAHLKELRHDRANLVKRMRDILDSADSDQRSMTAEENAEYERMEADLEKADDEITTLEQQANRRSKLDSYGEELPEPKRVAPNSQPVASEKAVKPHWREELAAAVSSEDRSRAMADLQAELANDEAAQQRHREFVSFLQGKPYAEVGRGIKEYSALQMDSDTAGGSLVASEQFSSRMIEGLDENVFMRQISTVLPMVMAHSLGIAAESADPADSDWTVELSTGTLDTTMTTSKRSLRPRDLAKRILVSEKLLRHAPMAEAFVRRRLLFKMGITQEKAFLTGSGAGQPLGIFTASADGISTSRDVNTDNTTTAVTADGLYNALYNQAEQYLRSANLAWIFHRTVIRDIRKLKDGNSQYIWNPGLAGEPNTLLGRPVYMSEYAPNTMTTGLYVGIIGDFSYYYSWMNCTTQPTRSASTFAPKPTPCRFSRKLLLA
jgi:HK97 family phage major capsid protein